MKHPLPAPPTIGERDGLSFALFEPPKEPLGGVVICHGAGSSKESHFDFARAARAHGIAAVAFDARGHGQSHGPMSAGMVDDVVTICALLREHAPRIALRGSSMGGFAAICAAAQDGEVDAVVAICPAPEDYLLRGLRAGTLEGFECDRESLEPWLERASILEAAALLGPRAALLLLHAEGDPQIPYAVSEEIHARASEPKRLLVIPGGHHRSIQHDAELQGESLRFIARAFARCAEPPSAERRD